MKIGFIGDIVGEPGRSMIKTHLQKIRQEEGLDFVIANYENASHGFGLTQKNCDQLLSYGIDVMTGGNHTWDKKEIIPFLDTREILRPHNYPQEVPGTGCKIYEVCGEKLAVINLLGHFSMPYVDNVFRCAKESVEMLQAKGIKNIFIDFHAEATSEKRAMLKLLEGEVSAIIGTHTHVSTDDFQITQGTAYLSDIGLTGCRDNVIGMDAKVPINTFMTGIKGHFEILKNCKKILQIAIVEIEAGATKEAYKLKVFDNQKIIKSDAWKEE